MKRSLKKIVGMTSGVLVAAACVQGRVSAQTTPATNMRPELRALFDVIGPHMDAIKAAGNDVAALRQAAANSRDAGLLRRAGEQPHWSQLVSFAGDAFIKAGSTVDAMDVYQILAAGGENVRWQAYGHVRHADLLPATEKQAKIAEHTLAIQMLVTDNPATIDVSLLVNAVQSCSDAQRSTQQQTQAIATRNRLRLTPGVWTKLSDELRGWTLSENARDFCALGDVPASRLVWKEIPVEAPTLGLDTGDIVFLMMEGVRRCSMGGWGPIDGAEDDLKELFNDPKYRHYPESLAIGSALLEALDGPNRNELRREWRGPLLERWLKHEEDWLAKYGKERWLAALSIYSDTLNDELSIHEVHSRWNDVLRLTDEYLAKYSDSGLRQVEWIQSAHQRAVEHL